MNENLQIENSKKIINKTWLILLSIIVITVIKYLLGYWNILLFDLVTAVFLLTIIILNLFIKNSIILYRMLSFLILIYSMFGLLLPPLAFISISYTIIASATYLLPLVVYVFIVKKRKNQTI